MNTPMPPTEPLDAQERELARILRALPAGEPSAALDAAILRAANNATATQKRRGPARLLASGGALWGIGSAAAAVLALGVVWQMRYGAPQGVITESAPRAQAVSEVAEDEAVSVDLGETRADAPAAAAPAAPMEMSSPTLASKPQRANLGGAAAPAMSPPPPPAPEPYPADHLDEHVARDAAPAVNDVDVASVESTTVLTAEQMRKREEDKERADDFAGYARAKSAAAAPPPASAAAQAQDRAQEGASAVGGLAAPRQEAAPMKPATWLAEVRRLRDAGEIAKARAKLVEFRQAYPNWVIPTDLAPLLSE